MAEKYRITRRFDDSSHTVLWRGDELPTDEVVGQLESVQRSLYEPTDVPTLETDWLFIERKRQQKRGWKVIDTCALVFDLQR